MKWCLFSWKWIIYLVVNNNMAKLLLGWIASHADCNVCAESVRYYFKNPFVWVACLFELCSALNICFGVLRALSRILFSDKYYIFIFYFWTNLVLSCVDKWIDVCFLLDTLQRWKIMICLSVFLHGLNVWKMDTQIEREFVSRLKFNIYYFWVSPVSVWLLCDLYNLWNWKLDLSCILLSFLLLFIVGFFTCSCSVKGFFFFFLSTSFAMVSWTVSLRL